MQAMNIKEDQIAGIKDVVQQQQVYEFATSHQIRLLLQAADVVTDSTMKSFLQQTALVRLKMIKQAYGRLCQDLEEEKELTRARQAKQVQEDELKAKQAQEEEAARKKRLLKVRKEKRAADKREEKLDQATTEDLFKALASKS